MQRAFNVFSPTITAYAGEQFAWTVNPAELGTYAEIKISSTDANWPLTPKTYSVTPGSNLVATVSSNAAGTQATFNCTPSAPNPQTIYVAHRCSGSPCNGATVAPGGHIIWTNDSADVLIVTPDPKNANYWPLDTPAYAIPPNSWLTLEISAAAALGKSYGIIVTTASGANPCDILGQPIIIVQSNGAPTPSEHRHHGR
ncbi:MAG TPA: hypothetical protein VMD92_05475 [Acidobacteriaceae bacterium]|nr:hypothetical protein [Acidobacteriaceae bacterium]